MKKLIFFVILFLILIDNAFANTFIEKTVMGYNLRVFKYDTKSGDFIFKVGVNPDYGATDLRTLMERNNGISAINGTYFCPADYRECGGQDFTDNERYIKGFKIGTSSTTGHRVVFAVDKDNKPFLFQSGNINARNEEQIYYGISNFPLLLRSGESKYKDYINLGVIDSKMKAKLPRNFICSDYTDTYIFTGYTSSIELEKLPEVLLEFGCRNAINLDAGASNAMIYNGRYIVGPGRDILDGVIIERKGLDVNLINSGAIQAMEVIKARIEGETYDEKIVYMNNISNILTNYRQRVYDKYSRDTYGKDGKKDGYEIYMKSLENLSNIYLVNYLIKLTSDTKIEFAEEEKIKQEEKNKESGLF